MVAGVLGLLLVAVAALSGALASARWGCDGLCSGHGYCLDEDSACRCIEGFVGPDCSQRVCPGAVAWVDYPKADGTAHAALAECANMGHCNRDTGQCECRRGFTGAACERMLCPFGISTRGLAEECSGQGRCLSMRNAALEASSYQSGLDGWDADMSHGCICDPGFEGPACQLRSCPTGKDPAVPGEYEVQIIECTCFGSCSGSVTIQVEGRSTTLPSYSTPELIQLKLQQLPGINIVDVATHQSTSLCSELGTATMVTFLDNMGNIPNLQLDTSSNLQVTLVSGGANSTLVSHLQSIEGTIEEYPCSRKGACETSTGMCECNSFYSSSDGLGGPGNNQDCGYFMGVNAEPGQSSCGTVAGVDNSTCFGRGDCVDDMCVCDDGHYGELCQYHECSSNFTWFGPDGHQVPSSCSSMGVCDHNTGGCNCDPSYQLWEGDACELLACAGECSNNGPCLTMAELGAMALDEYAQIAPVDYSHTWDASHLRTCHCEYADTADSQGAGNNAAYAGPYASSVPGKKGYDCGRWKCPLGDNIQTRGENEIQTISCNATGGWFYLTFKTNRTDPILHNATADIVKTRLEDLKSVSMVSVTIEGSNHVCDPEGEAHVEFLADTGDLPLMIATTLDALDGNVNVLEKQRGTRERAECSQQGSCDEKTGICRCVPGLISSDGNFEHGDRGDCSFFNIWATAYYHRCISAVVEKAYAFHSLHAFFLTHCRPSEIMDSVKGLDVKGGDYQQRYVLMHTAEIRGEEELFDALFSCGEWCYEGNIYIPTGHLALENLPSIVSLLQRQQSDLHASTTNARLSPESVFSGPLQFLDQTQTFVANHLMTEHVQKELWKWSNVFAWIDDDERNTYFEIQVLPPACMQNVACMASKTYIGDMLYIALYFEGTVYMVIKSAEGEQTLLDIHFPSVVHHGQGLHISTFNDPTVPWKRLTLWHNVGEDTREMLDVIPEAKFISIQSPSYMQTYLIMRSGDATKTQRDVLFRFGSWCYSGRIELASVLNLSDIQHVIPALRMQQSRLGFLCDVRHIPEKSRFAPPLAFLTELTPLLEHQLLQSENVLQQLMQSDGHKGTADAHLMSWIDGDSSQTFYEFQMADDPVELANVELVASKSYHPSGVIFVTILFKRSLYVILCDGSHEQPLLDSSFPDISTKGRGYQLNTYSDGVIGFRALRKVSIWQAWPEDSHEPELIAQDRTQSCEAPRQYANESIDDDDKIDTTAAPTRGQTDSESKTESRQGSRSSSLPLKTEKPKTEPKAVLPTVARPHHIRHDESLESKLAEIRAQLGSEGTMAPWDKHGKPLTQNL